ncbi:hypothetical protein ADP71_31660 [Vitreoscilla sp. C1]|uniref:terminase small subunit n=1 Tax=Vitreoscilla sp. (strain C1) TaxID=96942 RepID=UPI00148EECB0|nr:terminase small subunit [Vitreoscilla sp. C1]AUZ06344.2 hypothetical protein ADP71_31660 [Vitreoscilla sp. C1]
MEINEKHHIFAKAKAGGASSKDAALAAGYTESSARQQGSRLALHAEIKALIEHYQQQKVVAQSPSKILPPPTGHDIDAVQQRFDDEGGVSGSSPLDDINATDPLDWLLGVMLCKGLDEGMRVDAAKAALPYKHAKLGAQGKKEGKEELAKQISRQGGLSERMKALKQIK